jgi:ubiquinone/menaquinone biosynthesis C-methylase UbiE
MNINESIKKYWIKTPQLFSEQYETSPLSLVSPVNLFLHARRKRVLSTLKNLKGKKVLDVGCGSGVFVVEFVKRGASVIGIDYSKKMIELAENETEKYKLPKNKFKLHVGSAANLPFKNSYFDIILATGLTDYLSDMENEKFIKEAARTIKKSGQLLVSFPSASSPFSFFRSGLGLFLRQKLMKLPPIKNEFDMQRISQLLLPNKFKIIKSHKVFLTMWMIHAVRK